MKTVCHEPLPWSDATYAQSHMQGGMQNKLQTPMTLNFLSVFDWFIYPSTTQLETASQKIINDLIIMIFFVHPLTFLPQPPPKEIQVSPVTGQ